MKLTEEQIQQMRPSAMITYALQALELVEKSPGWKVDIETWHQVKNGICFACLGGIACVVAVRGELGAPDVDHSTWASEFGKAYDELESALDYARKGNIEDMFRSLGKDPVIGLQFDCHITDYDTDPERFIDDMKDLAYRLEQAGY